jgi:hypothetical protein
VYNKLFTKILDSSIWLAPDQHRIVWITFLAAMDEDGFVQFASVANLAYRARVSPEQAQDAVTAFEGPDTDSGDPTNEGRRIEKVPGGWIVLNAEKYRAIVSREVQKENTRARVAAHRAKKRNADVTPSNASVTPSEAEASTESEAKDLGTAPSGAPRKKSGVARIRTQVPEGDWLTPADLEFARSRLRDMNIEATFDDFKNHHIAKGTLGANWHAAWRTWVMNCVKGFAYVRRSRQSVESTERTYSPAEYRALQKANGG